MNEYTFFDIHIGLEESLEISIDLAKINKFLEISNDTNPLHTDPVYAKQKGFNGTWCMDCSHPLFTQPWSASICSMLTIIPSKGMPVQKM